MKNAAVMTSRFSGPFTALLKREFLEGKNYYFWLPVILLGGVLTLFFLMAIGFGSVIEIGSMEVKNIYNLGSALERAQERDPVELPAAITAMYWLMAGPAAVTIPFVVFFSLLGALYEERRDRSVLFWKSMPVSDWQEVLAKLLVPVLGTLFLFLGAVIAMQLLTAILLSLIVLLQGGPISALWPLGLMVTSWVTAAVVILLYTLWALPVFAWILLVSAYAPRMPFVYAMLPPTVVVVVEAVFFETGNLLSFLGRHLGGWMGDFFANIHIDSPRDLITLLFGGGYFRAFGGALTNMDFWVGLLIGALFLAGAVELRKRSV